MRSNQPKSKMESAAALALAAGLAVMVDAPVAMAQPADGVGDQIVLTGTVRDFIGTHPDFDGADTSSFGQYASNVGPSLDLNGLPIYLGTGLRVTSQWFDKDGNPIAPYGEPGLAGGHFDVDVFDMAPSTSEIYHEHQYDDKHDVTYVDIFNDPNLLYDSIVGAAYPNDLRVVFLNPHNGGGGTFVLEAGDGEVWGTTADGFDATFSPSELQQLRINFISLASMRQTDPGTSQSDAGDRDDALSVRIFDTVTGELVYELAVYNHYKGPDGDDDGDDGDDGDDDDGDHSGDSHDDDDDDDDHSGDSHDDDDDDDHSGDSHDDDDDDDDHSGDSHDDDDDDGDHDGDGHDDDDDDDDDDGDDDGSGSTDAAPVAQTGNDACGSPLNDTVGTFGAAGGGGVTDASTFHQWFRDVPAQNLAARHDITLTRNSSGVYEFMTDNFFPVDGELYGNNDGPHNDLFTYTISADFTYDACEGQFFEFEGNDDAWLFINGQLVIDLGGISTPTRQYVAMDRLGLVDGESYSIEFFYAKRHTTAQSVFNLRTNMLMQSPFAAMPMSSALFD